MADVNADTKPASSGVRRIVLFSLDGTLIRSNRLRGKGWASAYASIRTLTDVSLHTFVAACGVIYESHWKLVRRAGRGHPLFAHARDEWNTRVSYALLLSLADLLPQTFDIENIDVFISTLRAQLDEISDTPESFGRLLRRAEQISDPDTGAHGAELDNAVDAFWSSDMRDCLCDRAESVLSALRSRGIEYYVMTDGYPQIHWRQIRAVGLECCISYRQLLARHRTMSVLPELHALDWITEWYAQRAAIYQEMVDAPWSSLNDAARQILHLSASATALKVDGLTEIARIVVGLKNKIIHYQLNDVPPEYMALIIHAVNQSRDNPARELERGNMGWNDRSQIRIATVSTRSTDVTGVLSCSEPPRTHMPTLISYGTNDRPVLGGICCQSIKEAGEYLSSDEFWEEQTDVLTKPTGLFQNVFESTSGSTTALSNTIFWVLAGVAAINSVELKEHHASVTARAFVDRMLNYIVADVRHGRFRHAMAEALAEILNREGDALTQKCEGLQTAAAKLLLRVGLEHDDRGSDVESNALSAVATFLERSEDPSDIIDALYHNSTALDRVCRLPTIARRYREVLKPLVTSEITNATLPMRSASAMYNVIAQAVRVADSRPVNPPLPQTGTSGVLGENANGTS